MLDRMRHHAAMLNPRPADHHARRTSPWRPTRPRSVRGRVSAGVDTLLREALRADVQAVAWDPIRRWACCWRWRRCTSTTLPLVLLFTSDAEVRRSPRRRAAGVQAHVVNGYALRGCVRCCSSPRRASSARTRCATRTTSWRIASRNAAGRPRQGHPDAFCCRSRGSKPSACCAAPRCRISSASGWRRAADPGCARHRGQPNRAGQLRMLGSASSSCTAAPGGYRSVSAHSPPNASVAQVTANPRPSRARTPAHLRRPAGGGDESLAGLVRAARS